MRHLTFSLIAGYPSKMSKDEMTEKITEMVKEVNINLGMLPGVSAHHGNPYYLGDTVELANTNPDQVRVDFRVSKTSESSWNEIMSAVNKVYGPHYKFLNR